MTFKIDGRDFDHVDKFAFDECHKIYLIETEQDEKMARSYDYDLWPISEIPEVWARTCPLRFISTWSLESIIPQFHEDPVTFEFDDGTEITVSFCVEED